MNNWHATLAVPGDIRTLTGGYIYDLRVLHELRSLGHNITHIELPASFPHPTPADMSETFRQLNMASPHSLLIIDGLAFGALYSAEVQKIQAPIVALVHHPLAKESGLGTVRQQELFNTERINLSYATHVLVPSPHTAALLASEYAVAEDKITIARPGTDRSAILANPLEPPLILSVGIQLRRKGHDILLKALGDIVDLEWQATIVGAALDKAYAQNLQELKLSLGLEGRARFTGQVDKKTLAELYQSATLFALATRYEGYGIVFDEALVHGLPIVSCLTGAVPDTVPRSARLLVPPEQPIEFANALRDILTDSNRRNKLSDAATIAGQKLPAWSDTAHTIANALSCIKRPR